MNGEPEQERGGHTALSGEVVRAALFPSLAKSRYKSTYFFWFLRLFFFYFCAIRAYFFFYWFYVSKKKGLNVHQDRLATLKVYLCV